MSFISHTYRRRGLSFAISPVAERSRADSRNANADYKCRRPCLLGRQRHRRWPPNSADFPPETTRAATMMRAAAVSARHDVSYT